MTDWAARTTPAKLSNRHHLLAYLLVAGKSDIEAAEAIGYTPVRVGQIKKSPLFQALMKELRDEIRDKHIVNVADWLEQETGATLGRLKELREQDDSLPVALGATLAIIDRVAPKVTKSESETVHRHVWDRRDVQAMTRVLAEDGGQDPAVVDADFAALESPTLALPAGADEVVDAGVPTIDELLDEMEGAGER